MGPLEGVKVVDVSRLAPGPYASMLLADLGADVIRVDKPGGDTMAGDVLARGKRSIVLDLKQHEGREVLLRLTAEADVFLEGFRPGVMARLGADYETLSRSNPRLVYCSLTGYGQSGPLAEEAGHDIDYIAVAGVLGQLRDGHTEPRAPLNLIGDFAGGGMLAAFGIVSALFERERSGRGQFIDAAMIDGSLSLMTMHFAAAGRFSTPGTGMMTGAAPFYRCYRCADGRFVGVGALEPPFFRALWEGLELGPLPDQRDRDDWSEQRARIAERFATCSRDDWVAHFRGRDACVAPVLDLEEVPRHPHHIAREAFLAGPEGREQPAPVPRLSRTPGCVRGDGPASGEHSDAILAEIGYAAEQILALRARGAVA